MVLRIVIGLFHLDQPIVFAITEMRLQYQYDQEALP